MSNFAEAVERLTALPGVQVVCGAPLAGYTRFAIGGPAAVVVETAMETSLAEALRVIGETGVPHVVIGGGTNLIVSDAGFSGVVLRYTASRISVDDGLVTAEAGSTLQALVDFTIDHGLQGLHTMTGIPGSTGAAVYGNAGAYGHSISESVRSVRFLDRGTVREISGPECEFRYRESVFKRRKDWVVLSVALSLEPGGRDALRAASAEILEIRNRKYPPTMKCAGSIFKNLLLAELPAAVAAQVPAQVIREGKVPSAYFLEQVNAKGMRIGDIQVASYHANLIYNDGQGTAGDLVRVIGELKRRVRSRFALELEEEVQYVGFPERDGRIE